MSDFRNEICLEDSVFGDVACVACHGRERVERLDVVSLVGYWREVNVADIADKI